MCVGDGPALRVTWGRTRESSFQFVQERVRRKGRCPALAGGGEQQAERDGGSDGCAREPFWPRSRRQGDTGEHSPEEQCHREDAAEVQPELQSGRDQPEA